NVLVSAVGRLVLLDFGLATNVDQREFINGQLAGTPAYLSPEQWFDANVSTASDWYSVGATLYHALTGTPPFVGTPREVIERKMLVDPEPVTKIAPETPDELSELCMALLRRDPALRLSGREVLARVSAVKSGTVDSGSTVSASGFVGRADALSTLRTAFETARAGNSA